VSPRCWTPTQTAQCPTSRSEAGVRWPYEDAGLIFAIPEVAPWRRSAWSTVPSSGSSSANIPISSAFHSPQQVLPHKIVLAASVQAALGVGQIEHQGEVEALVTVVLAPASLSSGYISSSVEAADSPRPRSISGCHLRVGFSDPFTRVDIHSGLIHVVLASMLRTRTRGSSGDSTKRSMQKAEYGLRKIALPRARVNKPSAHAQDPVRY
jgi:hypothetical protein